MGKGGASKGWGGNSWGGSGSSWGSNASSWSKSVVKPTITKEEPPRPWRQQGNSWSSPSQGLNTSFERSGKGGFKGGGNWHDGKSGGKKGGKSKGKGKFKCASLNSDFWEKKMEDENRTPVGDTDFAGCIHTYNVKFGWGLIAPDDPDALPEEVLAKLAEERQAKLAAGKEMSEEQLVYFRKPDVNHGDGFKLTEKGTPCTFKLYVDDKGAGAYEVSHRE